MGKQIILKGWHNIRNMEYIYITNQEITVGIKDEHSYPGRLWYSMTLKQTWKLWKYLTSVLIDYHFHKLLKKVQKGKK